MNLSDDEPAPYIPQNLQIEDKWIISKYNRLVADVTDNLEKFELGLAVSKLYDFIWDVFCDWYIEIAKVRLGGDDEEQKAVSKAVLVYVFSGTMKLLHPFMPFITEEIWQTLPHKGKSIMVSAWPEFDEKLDFADEESQFEKIMELIRAIRNRRAEMNVPPSKKATVLIETGYPDVFDMGAKFICRLASASEVTVAKNQDAAGAVRVVTDSATA